MSSIVGMVRVVRGSFPSPVLVTLTLHGATIATCYTDSDGRFSFNALPSNLYHVAINDELYQPFEIQVVAKPDVQPLTILQVTLVPRKSSSTAVSGPYVVSPADLTKNYPKSAVKEYERGVKKEAEGKFEEAIEHYRKAAKDAPDFALAHNNLGSLYIGKSQFPEAQKEFEECIRLAPGDSKAYFNMANLMLLTGKLPEAEHYLQEGFRKQPDSAFGFFVQGSVMERRGNLREAERALQHALELNPKMTRPHLELVNLYLREQRSSDAVGELQKFLQLAPADPFALKARELLNRLQSRSASPQP
jgi:tetratricopeptide (TPR) repeat protein